MVSLSLAMIVRNEELTLQRVLTDAAAFCDELVVLDTGSTDSSRQIAVAAGARVLEFAWVDDFSAARNASFAACRTDWIIWLDGDDHVPAEVQAGLRAAKSDLLSENLDGVYLPYRYHFDAVTDVCTLTVHRERLIRRAAGLAWAAPVHEAIDLTGRPQTSREDLYVEHRPPASKDEVRRGRNLAILLRAHERGDRSTRTLFYLGNELRDVGSYEQALVAYSTYRLRPGPLWEHYDALLSMARCHRGLGEPDEEHQILYAALELDPSRAEAYLALGLSHFRHERWEDALPFYAAADSTVRPAEGFVDPADYTWRACDHLGVCLMNTGRYREGIAASVRSLELGNPEVGRLRGNVRWALEQM